MAEEIELKLELAPGAVEDALGSGLLGEPTSILQQTSTYFDTTDRKLFDRGFTLRIRKTGNSLVQTVKATGESASLFARSEWETPVDRGQPVLDHFSPIENEFGTDIVLVPKFDVEIERRIWNFDEQHSKIEVAVDQGEVVSGERRMSVREVELELKDGDPARLFIFARKLDATAPFRFGVRSKAERGFALIDAERLVYKAERLHLEKSMRASTSFQTIAESCFRHFRLNEDILLRHRNPEALHQARVAIRRLRSAFSIYKPMLPGDEPQRLKDEFRWLAQVLGEARNVDVLLPKANDADMRSRLDDAREKAYDDAIAALTSSRARALMLDFNEWLRCGGYLSLVQTAEIREQPAADFARSALQRMRKKLKKHGQALAEIDDEHRHEARKDAKKFRYAAEFFAALFDDKRGERRHEKFIALMESLQDELGALNDLVTGPDVLEKLGLSDHPARDSMVSHADKSSLIDAAQIALDEVIDAKRFWK
ncbi:CHAD domain-containing protein (plasmid) [Rhizobium sp. CC1099]|uniref:CYTH and CHAD domain-containing protein n=1 Tax=Rhizobium sp. CC1099 TaxID=3039160 RepID=UPI0024B24A00|nr:CHAD domain-containing protein [Rhizobium sp. CC1099]WFU92169.1 CHAD domain-containing protein [Rhizobium sp. CC1099]